MVSLLIFFFCCAIIGSFLCSTWESVLLSVTQPYIGNLKQQGKPAGQKLETLKGNISRPLTAILTLNTIANTAGSMGVMKEVAKLTNNGIIIAGSSALMVVSVLLLSEIIPKNLGAKNWRLLGPFVAHCLHFLCWLLTPLIWLVELVNKGEHPVQNFNRDELQVMADLGRQEGKLDEGESRVLKNLLRLRDTRVHNIMTPRVVVFSLLEETTVQQYLDEYVNKPFSRILLHTGDPDNMTGFALKDDILLAAAHNEYERTLGSFRREIISLPAPTTISYAFDRLLEDQQHIALVHDEYGGLEGLITMEDVVETLIGLEIVDEVDTEKDMQAWARSQWKRRAKRMGLEWDEAEPGAKQAISELKEVAEDAAAHPIDGKGKGDKSSDKDDSEKSS